MSVQKQPITKRRVQAYKMYLSHLQSFECHDACSTPPRFVASACPQETANPSAANVARQSLLGSQSFITGLAVFNFDPKLRSRPAYCSEQTCSS
jgi:hypothetical protein